MERFALYTDKDTFETTFDVSSNTASLFEPNYNVSAGNSLPIIFLDKGHKKVESFRWGIQKGNERITSASVDHAKSDTLLFPSLELRRCIIPASGFYIWKTTVEDPFPFYIRMLSRQILGIAGVYDTIETESGHTIYQFTALSVPSNDLILPLNKEMPLILTPENQADWLNGGGVDQFVVPNSPEFLIDMMAVRVPDLVNDTSINTPELIQPIPKLREEDD